MPAHMLVTFVVPILVDSPVPSVLPHIALEGKVR
jgi:hypothetical protein